MKKYRQSIWAMSMLTSMLFLNISVAKAFPTLFGDNVQSKPNMETHAGFIENKGQVRDYNHVAHPEVKYSLTKGNTSVFVLPTGIAYQFTKIHFPEGYVIPEPSASSEEREKMDALSKQIRTETFRMDMELIGANKNALITTEGKSEDYINFYTTNTFEVYNYSKLIVHEIYPGIDWVIYNNENGFKYDFALKANADASLIKMKFVNQEGLKINQDGGLTLSNRMGSITEKNPVSIQNGKTIETVFENKDGVVSFKLGNYNSNEKLTIDPTVVWATYYGGTAAEAGRSSATDALGNVYLAGYTASTTAIASGGHQNTYGGGVYDGYLVKFNSAGTRLWSTYYGGTSDDYVYSCATFSSTAVYIAGYTKSTASISSGGHQNTHGGGTDDAFIVKFNSSGVRQWATYYGGTLADYGNGCAVDGLGFVYLCGQTTSSSPANVIATAGAYSVSLVGSRDAFLVKFNASGVRQWGTYYGGANDEFGNACTVDITNKPYLCGTTKSFTPGIIASTGAHQTTAPVVNEEDAFLVKFNSTGTARLWGTYYGGGWLDYGNSCVTDAQKNVYIAGSTFSANTASNYIAISGHQNALTGPTVSENGFLAKFDSTGVRQWGTYYGSNSTQARSCKVDNANDVYLAGNTNSATVIASGGVQNVLGGGIDAFIVKFNSAGVRQWGSYYGGTGNEYAYDLATYNDDVYFSGNATSTSAIAVSGHQNTYGGGTDGFLTKINDCSASSPVNILGALAVCSGSVNVYSVSPVLGATSYTWTLPGGWTGTSTSATISATVGATGGTISVTANNVCGSSIPTTLVVSVNSTPSAPASISGTSIICSGTTNVYSISAVAGATSYTWTLPGGWTGTSTTTSISTVASSTSGTISVVANNSSCSSTPATLSITVNSTPSAPLSISGTSTICSGTTNTYSISAVAGATSYTWTLPSGWSGTSTTTSITATAGTTSGNITVTANNACGSSGASTFAVTVNPVPATPSGISGTFVLCGGTTNTYSISAVAGATSYTWTLPSGWSGTSTTTSITATAGTTGGNITVTANNACGSSSAATSIAAVENIPSSPLSISGPATICEGTTNTYSIASVVGTSSYTWTLPSGWSGTSTTTSISATAGTTGGTISVTANNVCGSSSPTTLAVTVNPFPNNAVTSSSNTITATQTGATYQWLNCNTGFSQISGQTSQAYTAGANGSYAVQINLGGCSDTSACTVITGIGIGEQFSNDLISVFPNPTSGEFTIVFPTVVDNASIVVINVVGQIVYSNSFENQNQINLNIEAEAGVYFVKIVSDNNQQSLIKLIKQ